MQPENTSRDRYRLILESATSFGIVATDRDGIVTDWNAGAEAILGWPAEEMVGRSAERFFTPEDRATNRVAIEMERSLADGRAVDERWHLRKDGSRFWASGEMMPLRDEAGEAIGFLKILRDRTDEHIAGERLRANEERLRTILDAIDTAFAIVDVRFDANDSPVDYRFVEANPAFVEQAGVDLRGKWVTEFAPNLERFWFETYGRVASTGEPANFENYANTFERWFDVRAIRIGDPADRRIAIFFNDVTPRKRAEADLLALKDTLEQQVEARTSELNLLWNTSPDLLVIIDFQGVFRRVNPAWTTMLGYRPEELVGRHVNEFVLPDDHAETVGAYTLAAEGGVPRIVNRYRHKDGSVRWISWVAAPAGRVTYATGRDITAERAQAEALAKAEDALRQSQKMEAVGQLTGGLAHDFNNLLAGISGSLDMMQTRIRQGRVGEIDRYMTGAQGAVKRAAALTHRLLAFSRRQTLEPKPTDVNRLVAEMEDLIRRTVGPQVSVATAATDGIWSTLVDPHQLENALLNLCINARDAMPDGGRILIETDNRLLDERAARERGLASGQYVVMTVSDTGTGMTPDVIERAFDPFFTTKPIGVGTGLGLSMIYGFAQQSGGQVRIHSAVGRGTTVCLYLPRHHAREVVEAEPAPALVPGSGRGRTVLVIDDEPLVRMLVVDAVRDLGFVALQGGDGPEALSILRSDVAIDLLITDVGLPNGMNGRQVADAARELRPDLKVLFVTGYAENAALGHGHLEPGMQVVTKPFDMTALSNRIQTMFAD